jgi:hypothetical protein
VPSFTWQGWNDAADWCVQNKTNYDEGLKWVDTSIQNEERFENLETKSKLLAATGKTAEADKTMKEALAKANAGQLHNYARQLLAEKKTAEAVQVFQMNAQKNPSVWFGFPGSRPVGARQLQGCAEEHERSAGQGARGAEEVSAGADRQAPVGQGHQLKRLPVPARGGGDQPARAPSSTGASGTARTGVIPSA